MANNIKYRSDPECYINLNMEYFASSSPVRTAKGHLGSVA